LVPLLSTSLSTLHHAHHSTSTPYPEEISSKDILNKLKLSVLLHFRDIGCGEVSASFAVWAVLFVSLLLFSLALLRDYDCEANFVYFSSLLAGM